MTDTSGVRIPHHVSDIDTWKHPDRDWRVFVVLSLLGGFVGADHVYLRSFGTAAQKLIVNCCTFGAWWVWDILQVVTESAQVRQDGLTSPLDWVRGIGRGVFLPPGTTLAPEDRPRRSIVTYTLLAVFLGALGANRLYVGQWGAGLLKAALCVFILGWLIGWPWYLWDAAQAVLFESSVLETGLTAPWPVSAFVTSPLPVAEQFAVPAMGAAAAAAAAAATDASGHPSASTSSLFGLITAVPLARTAYRELVVPLLQPTVGVGIQRAQEGLRIANSARQLATSTLAMLPNTVDTTLSQASAALSPAALEARMTPSATLPLPGATMLTATVPTVPTVPSVPAATTLQHVQQLAAQTAASRLRQHGGGAISRVSDSGAAGAGPIIAGALTGLVLLGGAKAAHDWYAKRRA